MDTSLFIAAIGLCLRAIQEVGSNTTFPYWIKGTGGVELRLINDRIDVRLCKSAKRDATTHYHLVLLHTPAIHQLIITSGGAVLDACALPEHVANTVLRTIVDTLGAPDIEWHDWKWIELPMDDTDPTPK